MDHIFDSSQTCDYCGIPAESANAKGPCPKRGVVEVEAENTSANMLDVFNDVARRLEDLDVNDVRKVLRSLCVIHDVEPS